MDRLPAQIVPYLNPSPVMARRHYIETGTLRHFDVRYTESAALLEAAFLPTTADGLVVVALCETQDERREALAHSASPELAARPDVLVVIPPPLNGLAAEVQDCRCWQWVADNTPELTQDSYAAAEVTRQVAVSRHNLMQRVNAALAFNSKNPEVGWWHCGREFNLPLARTLSASVSSICKDLYSKAPQVRNELLNRRSLSSAAAAARMRLVERMLLGADQPELGMDPEKAPPEKSMYLSVLRAGGVHREVHGHYVLTEPPEDDPLRLRPALERLMTMLEESPGQRVAVTDLLAGLYARPYGVRPGLAPLLLAIIAVAHTHELAIYEDGTFLHRFGPTDFLRLTKAPATFEFQLCRVTGVRLEVFHRLTELLAPTNSLRQPELLDVVTPLCEFAASLPEYSRRSATTSPMASAVRTVLLSAREPAGLLFDSLPIACGIEPFSTDTPPDQARIQDFVADLHDAIEELRSAYPRLLNRLSARIAEALGEPRGRLDRVFLASRGARVALTAREPRLRTFALRLSDAALSNEAWTEALGSFVASKPPARWTSTDEARACDEIDVLGGLFRRVEDVVAFAGNGKPGLPGVRVALTRGDGQESARVVFMRAGDEAKVAELVSELESHLPNEEHIRLATIADLLRRSLDGEPLYGIRGDKNLLAASDKGSDEL